MELFGDDSDREQFFEAARLQAQREFEADSTNAQALVRWGGALLELAHYKQGEESTDMIRQAIVKLKQAISLDADRNDAYWCLGNAYTSLGFLCPDKSVALQTFQEASKAFKHCHDKEPSNETYKKALEMCEKAPEYYDGIQSHISAIGGADGPGGKKGAAASSSSVPEWVWDVGGWVILGAVVTGALLMVARSAPQAAAAAAKPSGA